MSTRPSAAQPRRRNRGSVSECARSGPSSAFASRNTVTASSNVTPCFAAVAAAFCASHSNTIQYIRNAACSRPTDREAVPYAPCPVSQAQEDTETRARPAGHLEHAKGAVLASLTSASGQRAPATINLRLAAVRRVAYEAADAGLLSPELAAGTRRVKGVRDTVAGECGRSADISKSTASPFGTRGLGDFAILDSPTGFARRLANGAVLPVTAEPLWGRPSDMMSHDSETDTSMSWGSRTTEAHGREACVRVSRRDLRF